MGHQLGIFLSPALNSARIDADSNALEAFVLRVIHDLPENSGKSLGGRLSTQ